MAATCTARVACANSCNRCTSCQSCNSCENCNSCQNCVSSCNSTGNCQACENSCVEAQTYWGENKKTIGSIFGTFSWIPAVVKDVTLMGNGSNMFDKEAWDRLAAYISQRNDLPVNAKSELIKTNNSDGGPAVAESNTSDVSPFSAYEYNRLYKIVHNTTSNKVNPGDKITAALFNDLADNADDIEISSSACKLCNASCDNGCDQCQVCVFCQNCDASCNASCDSGKQKTACEQSCSGYSADCNQTPSCEQTV